MSLDSFGQILTMSRYRILCILVLLINVKWTDYWSIWKSHQMTYFHPHPLIIFFLDHNTYDDFEKIQNECWSPFWALLTMIFRQHQSTSKALCDRADHVALESIQKDMDICKQDLKYWFNSHLRKFQFSAVQFNRKITSFLWENLYLCLHVTCPELKFRIDQHVNDTPS